MTEHWVAPQWGPPEDWRFESYEVPAPDAGEVTIRVSAAGVNPADGKHVASAAASGSASSISWPQPIGYEVSGVVTAVGPDTSIVTGPVSVGDEVIAFRISGGYAEEVTVPAQKVLRKPATLSHAEASNLLLAGTTATEMLHRVRAQPGETVLLHAASGAVGVSVLQQAAARGIRVIGTASPKRFDEVRRFGGIPVAYGDGLLDRVRDLVADQQLDEVAAAVDAAGTDEAVQVSLALVPDRSRIVTAVAFDAASEHGFPAVLGSHPDSARFRDEARAGLVESAERGELTVPIAREYPLRDAPEALRFLAEGHPGGKLALIP